MKAVVISISLCLLFLLSCNKKSGQQVQQRQAMQEQARQQAIQDSIAQSQAKRAAQIAAQRERERMNKQKGDTTSGASSPSTAPHKQSSPGPVQTSVSGSFTSSGDYALQVSSWRSQWKAREELKKWKERGYDQAYLMKFGNEKTGNVWYRVRLGHLQTRPDGEQAGREISGKYDVSFWISYVG